MTLEYLELMEEMKNSRKKCVKSFKSNTRVFDDNSIEVTPQEKGEPSQIDAHTGTGSHLRQKDCWK